LQIPRRWPWWHLLNWARF